MAIRNNSSLLTRRNLGAAFASALVLLSSIAVYGHHSVSGQFNVNETITLTGSVQRVDWVNPHIYVHVNVEDEGNAPVLWRFSTVPVSMARRAGISAERLYSEGKTVTVTAFPARDGTDHLGFLTRIDFSDGTFVSVRPDRL